MTIGYEIKKALIHCNLITTIPRTTTTTTTTSRPVSESESESERQRARNGASESERDFSRKRAKICTSEPKRAKFRTIRDFSFYRDLRLSALEYHLVKCGNLVSDQFSLLQHQHLSNISCFCGVTRCLNYRFTA